MNPSTDVSVRRAWMSVLALATTAELETAWAEVREPPEHRWLRAPEIGLAMLRARAGGTGARFNVGEMTVTRCSVALADGSVGHAYVGGRRRRHAELAALFDALLQDPARRAELQARVVAPLDAAQQRRRSATVARSAPTRVEFFTMVRGDA
jgi:alpha-D-ribose 1-methylphosphonate 5-triphosphate synthase subunit PhnG